MGKLGNYENTHFYKNCYWRGHLRSWPVTYARVKTRHGSTAEWDLASVCNTDVFRLRGSIPHTSI